MDYQSQIVRVFEFSGICINGPAPHDLQVHDKRLYQRLAHNAPLALGESYVDRWWDCERVDELISRVLALPPKFYHAIASRQWWSKLVCATLNLQSTWRADQVCLKHYNVGNELYERMLDRRMVYSCAYWKDAKALDEAQCAKLDLICRKLDLRPGMRVLDIGCGWGSFMKFAAENYGVEAVGYTLSEPQVTLGRKLCAGYPIEFILEDYRRIRGTFDRVVSIGMFEAVGHKNYRTFMKTVSNCLTDDGLVLLHTMGKNRTMNFMQPWVHKYIFPNGINPSIAQVGKAIEGIFVMEDWHNFGPDYDQTLLAWNHNFQNAWPDLSKNYSDRFKRMWEFYLLMFAGNFRSRNLQTWQLVLSKPGRCQPNCRVN